MGKGLAILLQDVLNTRGFALGWGSESRDICMTSFTNIPLGQLATLLEVAGLAFDISKVLKISKINYKCFNSVKLVKK